MILENMDLGLRRIEKILVEISWIVCVVIALMIVTDITMRYFLNKPLPASWEISEISMPYIVFFAFGFTSSINGHVRVSLIRDLFSPRVQRIFDLLANGLSFLICALITYWSWGRFWDSFLIREEIMAAIRIPWWVGKMAMPIGMGVFSARYLMSFFRDLVPRHQS